MAVSTRKRPRVRVTCVECQRTRFHKGRGLCESCYERHFRHGTLDIYPRSTRTRAEMLEDWELLSRQGLSRAEAAVRMGVSLSALEKALERAARAVAA